MIPKGKGIFIWMIDECEGNDEQLADQLAAAKFSHVTFKGMGGKTIYFPNKARLPNLVSLLKARGISPRIYQYIYGGSVNNALAEAAAAVSYCQALGVDGLEIDAEKEYNQQATQSAAKSWAQAYMSGLNALPASFSVSLCSYRYPSVQPWFPWSTFLNHPRLNFVMPQVYWQGAPLPADAGWQLTKSRAEYQALVPNLPYVPVGSAYCEWGWCSKPAQIVNFSDTAKTLGLPGISFWSLQHLPTIAGMQAAVFALDWTGDPLPPPTDPPPVPPPGSDCEPRPGTILQDAWLRTATVVTTEFTPTGTRIRVLFKGLPVMVIRELPPAGGFSWLLLFVPSLGLYGATAKHLVEVEA